MVINPKKSQNIHKSLTDFHMCVSQYKMRRNRGIKKLVTFALLGVFMFSNTIPYQQFIQKNRQLEIRVQSQKKSNGLDVGKAD